MNFEEYNRMLHDSLETAAYFHPQEIPNEIFAERESLGHGNVALYQLEDLDPITSHFNENDGALFDAFIAELPNNYEDSDILKYVNPELLSLLDEGADYLLRKIDSEEGLRSNLNISIGAAAKSSHIVSVEEPQMRTENNVWKMLSGSAQSLKISEVQPDIGNQLLNSQLKEDIKKLKQANLQMQEELNRLKASQQSLDILQKMDPQKQSQVEPASTVDKQIHQKDVTGGITTVNSLPLSNTGYTRTRRIRKPRKFFFESMQQNAESNNEKNIVLQSETIRMIAPDTEDQNELAAPFNERPATRNLRSIAKQSRRSSQVSVHKENNNDGIKSYYHDEKDESVDRYEDDSNNINLNKPKKKIDRCNINANEFTKEDYMMEYTRANTDSRYVCDVKNCNSIFKTRRGLTLHKLMHAGVKPYRCNLCHKSFRQKMHLSRHMLIHTGEKPYSCKLCNELFRHSNSLAHHLKIHTGEKPHMCKVCNRSFRHKCNLNRHTKGCTGKNQLK